MATRSKRSSKVTPETEPAAPIGTALVAHAERAADCELELIRLFLTQNKHHIARRRLEKLQDEFPETAAAAEARRLLQTL